MIERAPARWVTIRLEANLQRQPDPWQVILHTLNRVSVTVPTIAYFSSFSLQCPMHIRYFRQSRVGLRLEDVLVA